LATNKIKFADLITKIDMWQGPEIFSQLGENPEILHKGLLVAN